MSSAINTKDYFKIIDGTLVLFNFICRSCGSSSYTITSQSETFCNFCEGHVNLEGMNYVHGSSEVEKNLQGMSNAAKAGKWLEGLPFADALASTKDPYLLYGAASFYKFFSDFTYYDVNYNLGGFMYSNADKRSDEPLKNKYNAMALISKSKEYLFKALKIMSATPADEGLTYLEFMCNIKLRRYPQAATMLAKLAGMKNASVLFKYANMSFHMEHVAEIPKSIKPPAFDSVSGSANVFYYTGKYLAKTGDLDSAVKILDRITQKVYMPMAASYNRKIIDTRAALDF